MTKASIPDDHAEGFGAARYLVRQGKNAQWRACFRSDGDPRQGNQAAILRPRLRRADSRLRKTVGTQWTEEIANDDALLLRGMLHCDCGGVPRSQSGILPGAKPFVDAAREQDPVRRCRWPDRSFGDRSGPTASVRSRAW